MVEMAKRVGRMLTVVAFEGESFSPVCLFQELHSRLTLSRIMIHTPDEARMGVRNHMYHCPICTFMAINNIVFLNHVVVGHYWGSFLCGKCLASMAVTAWEMRRHFAGCGKPRWSIVKHALCTAKHIVTPSPAAGPGRPRKPRKGSARRHGRGRTVHQQSPFQHSPSRSKLRSIRSQCPEFLPMCINSIWYAIMSGRARRMLWRLRRR